MRKGFGISSIAIIAAMLVSAPAYALSLNLGGDGGLLSTGGNSGTGNSATVDGSNALGNSPGLLGTGLLAGSGGQAQTTDFNVGDTNGNLLLDLFGDGSGPEAGATLGSGGNSIAGLPGVGGGDTNLLLDLFGNGSGNDGGSSPGGNGGSGNGGTGGNGGVGGSGAIGSGGVRVASIGSAAGLNCFNPNANQMAQLVNRHAYIDSTFARWGGVANVKVVDVGLCDAAGARIGSQTNVERLQAYVAAHPGLRNSLDQLGRSPSEVIGADQSGQTLTVYVM